jgi:hypothetical protein
MGSTAPQVTARDPRLPAPAIPPRRTTRGRRVP